MNPEPNSQPDTDRPATILVVEDESIVARDIQRTLKKCGYVVPAVAASAEEALRVAAQIRPQLVMMDINIRGDRDGIELALELRRLYPLQVIFLSAFSDGATAKRAQAAQPFDFLLKPFEADELRSVVEAALRVEVEITAAQPVEVATR